MSMSASFFSVQQQDSSSKKQKKNHRRKLKRPLLQEEGEEDGEEEEEEEDEEEKISITTDGIALESPLSATLSFFDQETRTAATTTTAATTAATTTALTLSANSSTTADNAQAAVVSFSSFSSFGPGGLADHSSPPHPNQYRLLPSFFSSSSSSSSSFPFPSSIPSYPHPHTHIHPLPQQSLPSSSLCALPPLPSLPPLPPLPHLPYSHLYSSLQSHHHLPLVPSPSISSLSSNQLHPLQHQQHGPGQGQTQGQGLLFYKQQQQKQQLHMMQQQSTNLQQQQLQQQQLLLQRQHQQQQKLKQQQQQQLQQLHLQLHPLSPPPPPLVSANLTAAATGTTTPKGTTTETMAGTQDYQLQQQQMQTQMGAQPFSQIRQGGPPPSPSSSLTTSSGYPTLQQRRASLLQQQQQRPVPVTLSLPSAVVDEASACPSSSLPSVLINPFNNNNRTKNSHPLLSSERTPLRTPMLPLSSQEYQGIVASGALPVRQALQTHIATSGVKPPETKEEARAALEVMFQVRADKIRRAIEQGKLATAEALQHKVIKRRESIVEGTRKTSNKSHHRDRSMSAPSERVTFADTAASAAIVPPHSMQNRIVPNQPWFPSLPHHQNPHPHPAAGPVIGQEPISMHPYGTINVLQEGIATSQMSTGAGISLSPEATAGATAGDPMVIDGDDLPPPHSHPHQQDLQRQHQDTTFGLLSDDDLMSSFTIFAAKLGDSLLARDNFVHERGGPSSHQPQPSYGYNNTFGSTVVHNQQDSNNRSGVQLQTQEPPLEMMMVDTALPTLSPTASNESQSSSPWIPWHSGRGNGQEQDLVANSLRGGGAVAVHPFAQAAQPATALLPPQPPQGASHVSISSLVTNPQQQQQQQQQQAYQTMFTKDPRDQSLHYHHHPSAASAFGLGVQSVQIHPQAGFGGGVAGMSQGSGGSNVGEKQVEAWNQYVQYLLHQQEMAFNVGNTLSPPHQHPQQHQQQNVQQVLFGQQQQQQVGAGLSYMNSDGPGPGPGPGHPTHPDATQNQLPSTQTMDPHWQATMMTMMMDKNPTSEAIQGLGQQPGFYIANGVGIGAMAGTAGGG